MSPSTATAGATAVQNNRPQGLHGGRNSVASARPGRDANPHQQDRHGSGAAPAANSPMSSELADLMQEPPGGANHGRRLSGNPNVEGRDLPLEVERWQAAEIMRSSGWVPVHTESRMGNRAGARSHAVNQHTVLHPDDYVDEHLLAALVEDELGFTFEQLHSVYSTGGRIPSARHALRDAIDARLLDLARGGANMDLFSRITGAAPRTLDRALARARAKEGE